MSRRVVWAVMGVVLVGALFFGSRGRPGPATEDQRVHRIAAVIRCPTCENLSAALPRQPVEIEAWMAALLPKP